MTISHLDALDILMDAIRDSRIVSRAETDDLRDSYWQVRSGIDAMREMIQPAAIYPEPAPVENCPHPYDRDFAFLNYDPLADNWHVTCCCCVCGEITKQGYLPKAKRKRKKKEATP